MIKLELLVGEDKVDEIKDLLREIGIKKISLSIIKEFDEDNVHVEGYRGSTYIVDFIQKVKIEAILNSVDSIHRALDMLSIADIDAEVLIYDIMQHYNLFKRIEKEDRFFS